VAAGIFAVTGLAVPAAVRWAECEATASVSGETVHAVETA